MKTNAGRTADTTAHHGTMTMKKTTTTDIATEAVGAIEHAVPRPTRITAAVAVTKTSTVLHAHTGIAARSIAVGTVHGRLPKRAGTMMMYMPTVTENRNLAPGASTGAKKTSTATSHATGIASETGVIAKIERKTTIMSARKTGQETRIKTAGVDVIVKQKRRSVTTTTTNIAHFDEAAKSRTEKTAVETIATRKASVLSRTMW